MRRVVGVVLIGAAAASAVVLVWLATAQGAGLSPDSVTYIASARALLSGHGFSAPDASGAFVPVTHFPPLFPALLALLTPRDGDVLTTARALNAALFGLNVALAGAVVWSAVAAPLAGAGCAWWILLSLPLLQVHSMAWSEPLALFAGLACAALVFRCRTRNSPFALPLAGVFAAVAALTRYAGLALLPAGAAALLAGRLQERRAWRAVALFTAIGGLPIVLWVMRNAQDGESVGNRAVAFHPLTRSDYDSAIATLGSWFAPLAPAGPTTLIAPAALAIIVVAVVGIGFSSRRAPRAEIGLGGVLGIFVVAQIGFVLLARLTADAHIELDNRMLCPALFWGSVGVVAALAPASSHGSLRPLAIAGLAALGLLTAGKLGDIAGWTIYAHAEGQGFASRSWRDSAVLSAVRRLPPETALSSNGPDIVYLLTGRAAALLPAKVNANTRAVHPEYDSELEALRSQLACADGALVYLAGVTWRWYLPSEEDLLESIPLRVEQQEADGTIYRYGGGDRESRCGAAGR